MNDSLAEISIAQKALANARDMTSVLEIRDKAVAIHAWATAKGADEAAQIAMEVKLRAERKAGGFLLEMKENKEFGKGIKSNKLLDFKIQPIESSRWQRIASIPEPKFEGYITRAKEKTQFALLQVAREIQDEMVRDDPEPFPIPKDVQVTIFNEDFMKAGLSKGCSKLVLTDPIWENRTQWFDIGLFSKTILSEGGYLVAFTGNLYLAQAMVELSKNLDFEMSISVFLEANHEMIRQWFIEATPIVAFYKPPRTNHEELSNYLVAKKADRMKMFHDWGKNVEVCKSLIEKFTRQGETVIEPCAGGGSTIQACIETKRNCIAYENNPATFATLKKRFP